MSCSDTGSENNQTNFHRDEASSTITHFVFSCKAISLNASVFWAQNCLCLQKKTNSPSLTLGLHKDAAPLPTLEPYSKTSQQPPSPMKICRYYPLCPIIAAHSLTISQAKLPFEGKHLLLKGPPMCFLSSEWEIHMPWWMTASLWVFCHSGMSWRSSGHSGSRQSIPSCILQQVAMITSRTSLLPPCQDRTDTFSLQYLPKCFKGQVTLKEIPSRVRTPLYPVLHQHTDKTTTVKELILPM